MEFTIERAVIELKSVNYSGIIPETDIGYIRLSRFAEETSRELREAISDLNEKDVSALIFDLRSNGGGLLDQAKETAEAQRARCLDNRKNPLDRLVRLGFPLIRRTFEQADRLIVAMEARCYSENRTEPALCATRKDWMALFILIVISGWVLFISVLL
jgi:hypothetical protein